MRCTRADIVRAARSLVGVPFVHLGRDERGGLDCAGVLVAVRRIAMGAVEDDRSYPRLPDQATVERLLRKVACRLPGPKCGLPGDVVLMRYRGLCTHVGILTPCGIVQASRISGRVVEMDRGRAEAAGLLEAAYRLDGVV